jgi:hypothetical protein
LQWQYIAGTFLVHEKTRGIVVGRLARLTETNWDDWMLALDYLVLADIAHVTCRCTVLFYCDICERKECDKRHPVI